MATTSTADQFVNNEIHDNADADHEENTSMDVNVDDCNEREVELLANTFSYEETGVCKTLLILNTIYSMSSVILMILWLAYYFKNNKENDNYLVTVKSISAFDTEDRRGKVTNSTHHDDCDNVKPQINPWAMMVLLGYISLGTTLAIGNVVRQRITGISTCIRAIITLTTTAAVSAIILPEFIMPCHKSPRNFKHPNAMIFICFSIVVIVLYSLCPVGSVKPKQGNSMKSTDSSVNDELQQDSVV